MATKKLYEEDSFLTQCTANVLECSPKGDSWQVVLDQTVFFPEGGGQPSDAGTLGGAAMSYAAERDGVVYHTVDAPLTVGETVEAQIDWARRLDHIQQHSGEHILSYAIWKKYDVGNIGFHLGRDTVTIDLTRALTQVELDGAEDFANQIVWEDKPVSTFWRQDDQLETLDMRKKTEKVEGLLRIVAMEGGDVCTCCGTHVSRTGQVGPIKILRQDSHKGGVRIEFICGGRAIEDYRSKHRQISALGAALSTKDEGILAAVSNLREEAASLRGQLRARSALLMAARAKELLADHAAQGNYPAVATAQNDIGAQEAKQLLTELLKTENMTAAVVYADGERVGYLIGSSGKGDCKNLCQVANGLFGGKGGGSATFAQGSGKLSAGWQESVALLEKAIRDMAR